MNILQSTLLIGGALVAVNAFQKASAAGTLNFYPDSIKNIAFDGITPIATIGIMVQNPTGQRYQVRSLVANLTANGFNIGNVSSFAPTYIAPNSQSVYLVNVRLSVIGIVTDIINAFNGGGIRHEIQFKGFANVDNFVVPINMKYVVG